MTASPYWISAAKAIEPLIKSVDIGLHITLTDQEPIGDLKKLTKNNKLPTVRKLVQGCLLKQVNLVEIREEIQNQIDAFFKSLGQLPDFIDGHHHVHQLPGIREVIIEMILKNYNGKKPYLRVCSAPMSVIIKRGVAVSRAIGIGLWGNKLRNLAEKNGILVNSMFSGIYDFSNHISYDKLFERFLIELNDTSIIMCHPGLIDDTLIHLDTLTDQRYRELKFFQSNQFIEILKRANTELKRFKNC